MSNTFSLKVRSSRRPSKLERSEIARSIFGKGREGSDCDQLTFNMGTEMHGPVITILDKARRDLGGIGIQDVRS